MKNLWLICLIIIVILGGCSGVAVNDGTEYTLNGTSNEGAIVQAPEKNQGVPEHFKDILEFKTPRSMILNPVCAYDPAKRVATFKVHQHKIDWNKVDRILVAFRRSDDESWFGTQPSSPFIATDEITSALYELPCDLSRNFKVAPYDLRVVIRYEDGTSSPADVFCNMFFEDMEILDGSEKIYKCYRDIEIILTNPPRLPAYTGIVVKDHKGRLLFDAINGTSAIDIINRTERELFEEYGPGLVDQWLDNR